MIRKTVLNNDSYNASAGFDSTLLVNINFDDILFLAAEICNADFAFIIFTDGKQPTLLCNNKTAKDLLNSTVINEILNRNTSDYAAEFVSDICVVSVSVFNLKSVKQGWLCIASHNQVQLNPSQQRSLQLLADQIIDRSIKANQIKTIETALHKTNNLLRSILNTNPDYQIILNHKLEIVGFNNSAADFTYQFTSTTLTNGSSVLSYITPAFAKEFTALCNNALEGEKINYEHFVNRKPYENSWYQFTISPVYDNDKQVIALNLTGTNISDQKKKEKTIRHQSDSLSVIAQLQSHQVRQPVTSILGLMSLIKEDNYHPQKEYLIGLEKATLQLDEVIQTIVTQSRKV